MIEVKRRLVLDVCVVGYDILLYTAAPGYGMRPQYVCADQIRWFNWGPFELMVGRA